MLFLDIMHTYSLKGFILLKRKYHGLSTRDPGCSDKEDS